MNRARRAFLRNMAAGAGALAAQGLTGGDSVWAEFSTEKASPSQRPNVLFIAVDDLRPQLGCYGHDFMISPNLDRLASQGMVFDRSFCQVPVCGASRASLLSGVRPTRSRFRTFNTWVDKDLPGAETLPEQFKKNGYITVSNGKVYHHRTDDLDGWSEEPWRSNGDWVGRGYLSPENKEAASTWNKGVGPPFEKADVTDSDYPDGKIADKALSDLKRLKEIGKPFFLAAGFKKPHLPFNAPSSYWELYDREKIDLADNPFRPKDAPDASIHQWGELRKYVGMPKVGPMPEDQSRTLVHGYYACVSYVDAQIGRVLDGLERMGLADNTIVILWGDHGWNLGEHGLWCKHCNFQTSLRAPLIVKAPGFVGGRHSQALVEFVDIYPSLCELCGLDLPEGLEGSSFVPLLKDPKREWKKAIFSRWIAGDSVRTDRYLYTEWTDQQGRCHDRMLYDHQVDPRENMNIADLPENKELVEKLSGLLRTGWKPHQIA